MINYMRAALGPHGLLLSRSHAALMQRTNCAAHPAGSVPAQQQHSWQQARTAAAVTEAGSGAPAAAGAAADADAAAAHAVAAAPPKVRSYPTEPRVGVGMVILRQLTPHKEDAEVLLIRRGKEPNKGQWCFPGGSLELGETLAECAIRETLEETGLRLRSSPPPPEEVYSDDLSFPTPIAAADGIFRDADGRIAYHYALIDLAAIPEDPHQPVRPQDDVDAAAWFKVAGLRGMADLVIKCDRVAEEAVRRFTIRH